MSLFFALDATASKAGPAWRVRVHVRADATATSMGVTALHRVTSNRSDCPDISALPDLTARVLVRSLCVRQAVLLRGSRVRERVDEVEPLVDSSAPAAPSEEEEKSDGSNLTNQTGHGA